MVTKRIDYILLLIGAGLILISSYQLFFHREGAQVAALPLGEIGSLQAIVKIKRPASLDWRDGHQGSLLTEDQLVFTENSSHAEIKFLRGDSFVIGENTLVKISNPGELKLQRGLLTAKLENMRPFTIQMNGKEYRLTGNDTKIQIFHEKDMAEIGVLRGEAIIETTNYKGKVNLTNALLVKGETISEAKISFQLLTPELNQTFFTSQLEKKITFQWSPGMKAEILLATSPDFKDVQSFRGEGSLDISLNPGSYYWKVKTQEALSLLGHFSIIQEEPLEVIRPKEGEKLTLYGSPDDLPQVLLHWKSSPAKKYEVQWNNGTSGSRVLAGPSLSLAVKNSGPLRWRARLSDPLRPEALWSQWQNVQVDILPPLKAPSNLRPENAQVVSYNNHGNELILSWDSQTASEIWLEGPDDYLLKEKVKEEKFLFRFEKTGNYRWRVRAVDGDRMGEWSSWKIFSVSSGSSTQAGIQIIQLQRPDQKVTFSWDNHAESLVLFELSRDEKFQNVVLQKEVSGHSAALVIPQTGFYYWRSREKMANGELRIRSAKKVIIEPSPAPSKPDRIPDQEIPIEWKLIEKKSSTSFWDFIISPAYADALTGVVKLNLPADENAKEYFIEIYQDKELKNLILNKTLSQNFFEWPDVTPGNYYWRYGIIDYWGRRSPLSDAAQLKVVSKGRPEPDRPRLRFPIRKEKVISEKVHLRWTESRLATSYQLMISEDPNFKNIIVERKLSGITESVEKIPAKDGLYYWKIIATNEAGKTYSSTGRFQKVAPPEEVVLNSVWTKTFHHRWSVSWAPSLDSYVFNNNQKGEIEGSVLNGVELKGVLFLEKWIINGEFLRQSGSVFDDERYSILRMLLDVGHRVNFNPNHSFSYGVLVGFSSGTAYEIDQKKVKSLAVSSPSSGLGIRDYFAFNRTWELQSHLYYLLGEFNQLSAGSEIIRFHNNFFTQGGLSLERRSYSESEGRQTSFRISLGFGKEF